MKEPMTVTQNIVDPLLTRMVAEGSSDLTLAAGTTPTVLNSGALQPADTEPLDVADFDQLLEEILGEDTCVDFFLVLGLAGTASTDACLIHDGAIFRVSVEADEYGQVTATFRHLGDQEAPVMDDTEALAAAA